MKMILIRPLNSRQKTNNIFLAVLTSSLLILTFFIDPRNVSLLTCQFRNATGYSCPTCGLSRSFYAFANFDISGSFGFHLLGPVLYLAILSLAAKSTAEIIFDKKFKLDINPNLMKFLAAIIAGIWLVYWLSNFFQG